MASGGNIGEEPLPGAATTIVPPGSAPPVRAVWSEQDAAATTRSESAERAGPIEVILAIIAAMSTNHRGTARAAGRGRDPAPRRDEAPRRARQSPPPTT